MGMNDISLLLLHNGIVGKLISGDFADLLHKAGDALGVRICVGNLIQCVLRKFLSVHKTTPSGLVSAGNERICRLYRLFPM